jgi:cytochrome c-type biogenesis protein CcsB
MKWARRLSAAWLFSLTAWTACSLVSAQPAPPVDSLLDDETRETLRTLIVQDFQGRMKPLDTLSRETVMKVSKRGSFADMQPIDQFFSWLVDPQPWTDIPLIAVRHPGVKQILGVDETTKHVSFGSLLDEQGHYRLAAEVEEARRTPDKARSKVQRKLLSFDDRFNVFFMAARGYSLRVFPVPDDPNHAWIGGREIPERLSGEAAAAAGAAQGQLLQSLRARDHAGVLAAVAAIRDLQQRYGADVLPSARAVAAELKLNRSHPFAKVILPYVLVFFLLMLAYAWGLARKAGSRYSYKHPLYTIGMLLFTGTVAYHAWAFALRWIASGRAPLSNGYESLIFIGLMVGIAGLYYENAGRRGSVAALAALLAAVIQGVAMLPTFDPAISPLVPVLASFWLIIHVTIITASYGFLGLAAVMAMTILILYLFKGPGRETIQNAIYEMDRLHWKVLIAGIAFLTVGTFLGGVWANESWGRYWGWDPKETWSLVTILVYAAVAHLRFTPRWHRPFHLAAGSFAAISSVGMTYFGVNYFLAGLHSYAQGEAPRVPTWVYVMAVVMIVLIVGARFAYSRRDWGDWQPAGGHR